MKDKHTRTCLFYLCQRRKKQNPSSSASKPEDVSIIQVVESLLQMAYKQNASDIHIEPFEERTIIRFRMDGIMHDMLEIPTHLHELITMRIKILSRLRTDEHRAAQDGKLRFRVGEEKIDARVSIIPVVYGEKTVMRLLSEKAQAYELENLGFSEKDLAKVIENVEKPWGMILATGPTGSGKTTTLYSIVKRLNKREVNISTIEDPVENYIDGVNQIQINAKTNLTFANGLRSIVRQDPNIIMVGEIRDEETAKIAINAAMTGHLVLSTFHTNDAPTALPRFLDMGVQNFLVSSTVNLIIAQRLVRKVCEGCKTIVKPDAKIKKLIETQFSKDLIDKYALLTNDVVLANVNRCHDCPSGYKGRVGIYELLVMTEEIKELIMSGANAEQIKDKALSMGMVNMIEDGIKKMQQGLTTLEELLRVVKE